VKREIYVFSGTGNSLAVARSLANALGNCSIISIPGALKAGSPAAEAATVVLVFPLYFFGLPRVVAEFLEKVDLSGASRLFAVITRGGSPGCAARLIADTLDRKREERGGRDPGRAPLFGGVFYLTLWTNFVVRYRAPSKRRREALARRAESKIPKIARIVEGRVKKPRLEPFCRLLLPRHRRFLAEVSGDDARFAVTDVCSSCGLCESVCPVSNIRMSGGKPSWLHRCELCLACLHFCPETAIEHGGRTRGKRRCSHPAVCAGDLVELKRRVRINGDEIDGNPGTRS
jgi:ferredoxin